METNNDSRILETQRLLLRKYRATDFKDYLECYAQMVQDPTRELAPYTSQKKALDGFNKEARKPYMFAIALKSENKVVGWVQLKRYRKEHFTNVKVGKNAREIVYFLHEKYWRQGIIPEALRAVVAYAFTTLEIPEIITCHAEANVQSGKVQEEIGFKIVDRNKNYYTWSDGTPSARIQRKLTREEFLEDYKRMQPQYKVLL